MKILGKELKFNGKRVYHENDKPTPSEIGAAASSHTHNYAGSSSAGGNANAATKLATARTINGTSFDGTANITTSNWGTARTLTVGNTSKSVNGSENVSWSLNEIGAAKGKTIYANTAATAGWYRIATSSAGISRNLGTFVVEATVSGKHSVTKIVAGTCYGQNPTIQQLSHTAHSTTGISKARIVYHTTYDGNYAYLEVYLPTATATTINVHMSDYHGWSLVSPSTAGSIPSGYSNKEITFVNGGIVSNVTGALSGNASTATTLQTARTINGTSFNGSGNITTSTWGTARNISIADNDGTNTGTAVSVNGSGNATLKLPATIKASLNGNASTATSSTKATQDSAGQQINTTYIKGLSVSGKTITYTKGDGTTGTITTQDTNTTYSTGTSSSAGLTKLYTGTGTATDGTMTQAAIKSALDGKAASSHTHDSYVQGSNSTRTTDQNGNGNDIKASGFYRVSSTSSSTNIFPDDQHSHILHGQHPSTSGYAYQLAVPYSATNKIYFRNNPNSSWGAWNKIYHSGDKPTLSELGAAASSHTHNYAGSSSAGGNANAAVKLATARTINGTSFDGSANITTANWGTARNLTIGNTAKSVNGSGNVSWSLSEIGAAAASHTHSYAPISHEQDYAGTNSNTYIAYPKDGRHRSTTASITGYLKITLPQSWTSTMMRFEVDVYNYVTNETMTYVISGYNYSANSTWNSYSAYCISHSGNAKRNLTVRFGHDGTKCAIYIGEASTTWAYTQVTVKNITVGYSNSSLTSWNSGWVVGFTTTLGTVTGTITNPYVGNGGMASTANTLATARTINGTSFNGSANITTANWGTARTLTIGSTGKSVNGSGNVSWSLSEIGAAASSHTHNYAGSSSAGGNANAAVKLATARTINGTNFDGTGNITTSNWGTARTISLTGAVTGSASINGSANASISTTLANFDASKITSGTVAAARLPLSTSVSSTSTTTAATSSAVKQAYDAGVAHNNKYLVVGDGSNGDAVNSKPVSTSSYLQARNLWAWDDQKLHTSTAAYAATSFNVRNSDGTSRGFNIGLNSAGSVDFTLFPTQGWIQSSGGFDQSKKQTVMTMSTSSIAVSKSITPSANAAYNIGTSSSGFATLYARTLQADNSNNLTLSAGSPQYGTIQVQRAGYFTPTQNGGYSLGTSSTRFHSLYLQFSPNVSSDMRVKRNIKYFDQQTLDLNDNSITSTDVYNFFKDDLRIASYNVIPKGKDYKTYEPAEGEECETAIGFIAQDVFNTKVGKTFVKEDENGMLSYDMGSYQSLSNMALQGALNKIDVLEKENQELKERLKLIEEKLGM